MVDDEELFLVELLRNYTQARTKFEVRLSDFLSTLQADFDNFKRRNLQKPIPKEVLSYISNYLPEKLQEVENLATRIIDMQERIDEINEIMRDRTPIVAGIPVVATIHVDVPQAVSKSKDTQLILDYVRVKIQKCGGVTEIHIKPQS